MDTTLERIVDDDGKLKQRYKNKCINAKKEGLICELAFEEYCMLVYEAGLKSSDLGFTGNNYVLARYKDNGNYTFQNCRFITQKENCQEKLNHMDLKYIKIPGSKNKYNYCACGRLKSYDANYCIKCSQKEKSKFIKNTNKLKPSKDKLAELIKNNSFEAIGRMYGVTGKAVSKWILKYGL